MSVEVQAASRSRAGIASRSVVGMAKASLLGRFNTRVGYRVRGWLRKAIDLEQRGKINVESDVSIGRAVLTVVEQRHSVADGWRWRVRLCEEARERKD